jgi:hypothetical protein
LKGVFQGPPKLKVRSCFSEWQLSSELSQKEWKKEPCASDRKKKKCSLAVSLESNPCRP